MVAPNRVLLAKIQNAMMSQSILLRSLALTVVLSFGVAQAVEDRPPNVVVIFIDDMGYADINPFGAKAYQTPNLNRMASEGRVFTDFVVSSAVCSASRSALHDGLLSRPRGDPWRIGAEVRYRDQRFGNDPRRNL